MSSRKADKPTKKLKQACLPFKLANSPGDDTNTKCRKRKLSGTENEETLVEKPNVELLNGGTKCFIISDEDHKTVSKEIIDKDSNNKVSVEESTSQVISSLENTNVKVDQNISIVDTNLTVDENNINAEDTISISSSSEDNFQNNVSVNDSSDSVQLENTTPSSKNLKTPKRKLSKEGSAKKQESAQKQEERQRIKEEKEKAREAKLKEQAEKQKEKEQKKLAEIEAKKARELEKEREKKAKEEIKKAKELEKEQEKKQKEEEKKAKELEKEKERKQKEEERKAKELEKEKERKQKEEERKAKELEKEKQKKEKLLKDEIEKKKNEKVKAAFVGFFKPKISNSNSFKQDEEIIPEKETYFMPFQTKQDMKIAPFCRAYLSGDQKKVMDKSINQYEKNTNLLYLNLLKSGKHQPAKSEATWPINNEDDADVIIIETGSNDEEENNVNKIDSRKNINSRKFRWKLLQFDENKRPPYWGTWRKKSIFVKPRKPFAHDKIMFDYEIDSDDEWEEEDPGGESLHGSDDEKESEDDYEVDNDVFVPHGYLSDEEGQDNEDASEEVQKEKLKLLGEEFEAEIKKKTERIKPRLVGCIWIPNNVNNPDNVNKSVADTLLKYRCIWDEEEPIKTEAPVIEEPPKVLNGSENKKASLLSDSIMLDLMKFIHGNTNGIKLAATNFIDEFNKNGHNADESVSLAIVRKTIKNIATKSTNVAPWSVNKEIFEKYGVEYPKPVVNDNPKPSKSSVMKITNFMTPKSQTKKTDSSEKSCAEKNQNPTESSNSFAPKNLFNIEKSPKPPIRDLLKEEQKVNMVGGKKRITPILLSPKKSVKIISDRKIKEKSWSPDVEMACESTSKPNDNNV